MELTREEIEKLASYNSATEGQTMYMDEFVARIAKQLLREMDKPKVWEGAPEKAERAFVIFSDKSGINKLGEITYTRTLPKSRIDEIAEEASEKYLSYYGACFEGAKERLMCEVKSAILKDREERH